MRSALPKQYLPISGKPVIQYAIERLSQAPRVSGVVVVVAADDQYFSELQLGTEIVTAIGGAERAQSVLAGLNAIDRVASSDDWVLVHDAARPCVHGEDIDNLINKVDGHPVGGLLAVPVRDTMKRCGTKNEILATVARHDLWHALTPQMFRLKALREAIASALERGIVVTDEAHAMELTGVEPLLVKGRADNIKITEPRDQLLAEWFLRAQQEEA